MSSPRLSRATRQPGRRSFSSVAIAGVLLAACGGTDTTTYTGLGPAEPSVPPAEPQEGLQWATRRDASWVFAEDVVRSYELELGDAGWDHLRAHALEEEYQPAILRVDGIEIGQVGVRYKGQGSLRRCTRNGALVCDEQSIKVRFDEYEPAQRFFGLKRLNFNSKTHLNERLAFQIFRQMGVVAPRAVHARLTINGENQGVVSLVENIDGRFTEDRFEAGDGNLYKERWPNTDVLGYLSDGLRTNEEVANHDAIIAFHAALAAADAEDLPRVLASFADVDQLYAYLAVDRAIANYDGVTAFYCRGGCNNHNYYLYQHEAEARFTLIPWDLDNTFFMANAFDYVPDAVVIPPDCSERFPVFGGLKVLAPACDPFLQGLARGDLARYREAQARLLAGPFEIGALDEWIDEQLELLSPAVLDDPSGPGLTKFLTWAEDLRRTLPLLAERLRIERDGEAYVRTRLAAGLRNDFESATTTSLRFGMSARTTLETRFDIGLSEAGAQAGGRALLLDFELRGDAEPPWVRFELPFDGPDPFDLNAKSRLRFTLQADAPRKVRIAIGSEGYSEYLPRAVLGWDIEADGTRQELELALSDAKYPQGAAVADPPSVVLSGAVQILIDPLATGADPEGYLPAGKSEHGWLQIDNIEFVR